MAIGSGKENAETGCNMSKDWSNLRPWDTENDREFREFLLSIHEDEIVAIWAGSLGWNS